MKVALFDTKSYDEPPFIQANAQYHHDLVFLEPRLSEETVILAKGFPAVCAFIHDDLNAVTLKAIANQGTRIVALRCAGFNNIDLHAAQELGLTVVRVPAYSPYATAEHTVGLILMLNRKLYRAYNRVREDNFGLKGLLGFDLFHKTVGIIGTGKIGQHFAQIMNGFGCKLMAYDIVKNQACLEIGVEYVSLPQLLARSDIVSLHCPLMSTTKHIINQDSLKHLKPGAMLINTSRGGLIETKAVIEAIRSGQIGHLGIDVYEEEENLFHQDWSDSVILDDNFQRLQSFPNVVITAHQAYFTREAIQNIARTTLQNIRDLEEAHFCPNVIDGLPSSRQSCSTA